MVEAALNDNAKSRIIDHKQENHRYDGGEIVPYNSQDAIYEYFKKKLETE